MNWREFFKDYGNESVQTADWEGGSRARFTVNQLYEAFVERFAEETKRREANEYEPS